MPDSDETILHDLKQHPRVCSNCFRLRQHEDPVPSWIEAKALRTFWADAVLPERTRTRHADSDSPPGETVSETAPRTVCECGSFSAYDEMRRSTDAPLTKDDALVFTENLSDTLARLETEALERGLDPDAVELSHDDDVLFDAVRHLKSQPEYQFHDDRIFTVAVELACDRA